MNGFDFRVKRFADDLPGGAIVGAISFLDQRRLRR
jgi:hypothetical protein